MKKLSFTFLLLLAGISASYSQVVTSEPVEYTDPSTPLKLIVNFDQLDQGLDYVQNLIADADAGLDMYFWTWKPVELPTGHPFANGTWPSSNDSLIMTLEAPHIYSFTLTPTEFYGVDAATVYSNDIFFLVKPKDGGGFGNPDRKTPDLTFEVNPPIVERTIVYSFPSAIQQDDLVSIIYDNYREDKVSMQNLGSEDVAVFLQATLSDSTTTLTPSSIFTAGTNPDLFMVSSGAGIFEKTFIPERLFSIPQGLQIMSIKAIVIKRSYIGNGADRVDDDFILSLTCD